MRLADIAKTAGAPSHLFRAPDASMVLMLPTIAKRDDRRADAVLGGTAAAAGGLGMRGYAGRMERKAGDLVSLRRREQNTAGNDLADAHRAWNGGKPRENNRFAARGPFEQRLKMAESSMDDAHRLSLEARDHAAKVGAKAKKLRGRGGLLVGAGLATSGLSALSLERRRGTH